MEVFTSAGQLRSFLLLHKNQGKSIGLVPTMGALHEGHITLVSRAASENDISVCSIFVNPVQFNNPQDLAKYPRTLESDLALLEPTGCAVVFAPSVEEMYPVLPQTSIRFGAVESVMEGSSRPGHFSGVGIVVSKLFNMTMPDKAYFGQKDLQQVSVVRQLVSDLSFPVELVIADTVRETDGLAMSSRNRRLTPEERTLAPSIFGLLETAKKKLLSGEPVKDVVAFAKEYFESIPLFRLDYFEVVDIHSLQPLGAIGVARTNALCIAIFLGEVRLIDNIIF